MRNLRVQLLFSHLLLVLLMVLVMGGAVVNFLHLGHSIDRILQDNYKSVAAAQDMKEALERLDSAAAFCLAGQPDLARQQYREHWPRFEKAHRVEINNITEPGEKDIAEDLGRQFTIYRRHLDRLILAEPPMSSGEMRVYYFATLEPDFLRLKRRAQDVLDLNQAAIVRASDRAKAEARRATWMSVGITTGAFLLAILFALRMIETALAPLRTLSRQAEEIGVGHLNQSIELHRSDEVGTLASAFNHMAESLREAQRAETERLHRAERMSDEALQSLYDPVIVTDANGAVVHLNHAAEGLFGPASRAAGRLVAQVVSEERVAAAVERAIRQERVSAEEGEAAFMPFTVGATERTYRLRATPMRDDDGTLLGAVAVLEDVTHLRALDRLKTEFISVASHELRTPVTSLLLSVQLMEEEAAGPLTPEQREVVLAQRQDLTRLERTMRDLLDLTRLEAGVTPPRFEIVPPRELVEAAAEAVAALAEAKGLVLRAEVPDTLPPVRADRSQVTRVLVNLLNNAVHHTPEGGCIVVRAASRDGAVAFQVEDTGGGIPAEYLPRIFERFVQVPGATRGGAGLGLSIAKTIVNAHGSDISAKSTLGHGSTFTFTLPLAGEPALPAEKEETLWHASS